jgi:hypothetical protein
MLEASKYLILKYTIEKLKQEKTVHELRYATIFYQLPHH